MSFRSTVGVLTIAPPWKEPEELLEFLQRQRRLLPAVVPLFPHLEEQALIHLGEREDVGRVHCLSAQCVHAIEHVEEVAVGVDAVCSTPDMNSLITFCRSVAPGLSRRPRRYGSSSAFTKLLTAPRVSSCSSRRFGPPG